MLTPQDRLRAQLLRDGLGSPLSMSQVRELITHGHLPETVGGEQELALRTIRSLQEDGLVKIGDATDDDFLLRLTDSGQQLAKSMCLEP